MILNILNLEGLSLLSSTLPENRSFSLAVASLSGLVDGLSLCGLTLMILFIGYLLIFIKERKRAMTIGFVFLISVMVTYFLSGVVFAGLLNNLLSQPYYYQVGIYLKDILILLLGIFGILHIHHYFHPSDWAKILRDRLNKVGVPLSILIAVLAVVFVLPCVLPNYLISVQAIYNTFSYPRSTVYIFAYCQLFIIPMLIIMSVFLRAESYARHHQIASEKFRWLRLIKGLSLIAAAVTLYLI
jgi:cytochrome c biogenesis protein CcdA